MAYLILNYSQHESQWSQLTINQNSEIGNANLKLAGNIWSQKNIGIWTIFLRIFGTEQEIVCVLD